MQRQSFLKIAVVALLVLNAALLGWFVFRTEPGAASGPDPRDSAHLNAPPAVTGGAGEPASIIPLPDLATPAPDPAAPLAQLAQAAGASTQAANPTEQRECLGAEPTG